MAEVIVVLLLIAALIVAMNDEERRALLSAVRSLANDVRRRRFRKAPSTSPDIVVSVSFPTIALDLAIPGTLVEEAAACMRETLDPIEAFERLLIRRRVEREEARAALTHALRALLEEASRGTPAHHHCS